MARASLTCLFLEDAPQPWGSGTGKPATSRDSLVVLTPAHEGAAGECLAIKPQQSSHSSHGYYAAPR